MLDVVHLDDRLAVIHKPPGLLVHRTGLDAGETRFAMQLLRDQLGRHVWPVHRLDKGTSGLLVFALDARTAAQLAQAFEEGGRIRKTYRAVVRGWPDDEGLIDHPLRRLPDDARDTRTLVQPAQTAYRTLARHTVPLAYGSHAGTRVAVMALQPLTGRRHQLRRHMKHLSHPIIGDATHGKGPLNRALATFLGHQRLWLHAEHLAITHPVSGQLLALHAPPGPEWAVWTCQDAS